MDPNDVDREKLVEATLAILSLTQHAYGRVWKAIDFDLMKQLYEKGRISDPRNKAKSVLLTDEGLRLASIYLAKHFSLETQSGKGKSKSPRDSAPQEIRDSGRAHILCCTAKLLKEIGINPLQSVPDRIDEFHIWYANLLRIERRKCVLFTHAQTLFSFFVPGLEKPDFCNLHQVFLGNLIERLDAEQLGEDYTAKLRQSPPEIIYAKTKSRSVLGSMNDLAFQVEVGVESGGGIGHCNLSALNKDLNHTPMSALDDVFPDRAMSQALLRYQEDI